MGKTPSPPVAEAFWRIAELAEALGVKGIGKTAAPWVHKVDAEWTIAVNAFSHPAHAEPEGCMGAEVPPFHAAVWRHDPVAIKAGVPEALLVALLSPRAGVFLMGASEDDFIAAVQRATRGVLDSREAPEVPHA